MNKKRLLSSVLLVSILTANVKANHYSFDKNTTDDTETVFNKCCYIIMGTYNNGKTIIQLYQIVHTILLTKYLLSLCILRVDSQISLSIYIEMEN